MEYDMECTQCHEGAVGEDRAGLPAAKVCFECHDPPDPKWDSELLVAFFKERGRGEGKLFFRDSLEFDDLKFSHQVHANQGADCSDCHGDVAGGKMIQSGHPDFKHTCRDCHRLMKAPAGCPTCHDGYREDRPPADHAEGAFLKAHGRSVKPYFKVLPEDRCFFCHQVAGCELCHRETKPEWHFDPFFTERHGEKVRWEMGGTLAEAGCGLCHDASGCAACHQQKPPRSHTLTFKNRTHGFMARLDRTNCQVCHQQVFCVACHSRKEPISHRGQFRRGQQNHCYTCHFPLSSNTCYVCHKQTPGHTSLPRPMDAAHTGAPPASCRVCHVVVPHADNGTDCTLCH
jgi:hypothetical protein